MNFVFEFATTRRGARTLTVEATNLTAARAEVDAIGDALKLAARSRVRVVERVAPRGASRSAA